MKAVFLPVIGALAFLATTSAQQGAKKTAEEQQDPNRIVLDVTRVNLLFTVSDKKGRFVTDFKKDDFEIIENKKRQNIIEFTAETNLPLRLAILIDTSNSIRDRFRFKQEAAVAFIKLSCAAQDRAKVVSFDTAAELVADLTRRYRRAGEGVSRGCDPAEAQRSTMRLFACRDKLMLDQPLI